MVCSFIRKFASERGLRLNMCIMANKLIVVFGATGNLGAYTAVHLKEHGYDVIAVGRRKSDNGFFATKGIKYISVDVQLDDHQVDIALRNKGWAVIRFWSKDVLTKMDECITAIDDLVLEQKMLIQ